MSTPRPAPRDRQLHLVGNAHIDPVWLWRRPEGLQEIRATFQSAVDRMEEYPDFVFTCDSVMYLEWIEQHDPELFETIAKRVAEGRWQVVGGWWIEPDCNIPAGESFVRQALYGQRYLLEKFGRLATIGSNLDPFGHNATIPQLLRKSGMDGYVFLRPGPHEQVLPGQFFHWESPDGSRVTRLPPAQRVRHTRRGHREPPRQVPRPVAARRARTDGLLRRRQPRRRTHQGQPRLHPAPGLPGRPAQSAAESSRGVLRPDTRPRRTSPSTPGNCSTTGPAATRRTPGSRRGTAGPRTSCSAPRSGRPSPPPSPVSPTLASSSQRRGSWCCSTSSTTSWRAPPSGPPTTTRATSTAAPARSPPTCSTGPCKPSPAASTSRCASGHHTPGRLQPAPLDARRRRGSRVRPGGGSAR